MENDDDRGSPTRVTTHLEIEEISVGSLNSKSFRSRISTTENAAPDDGLEMRIGQPAGRDKVARTKGRVLVRRDGIGPSGHSQDEGG
jgi:hypothetical protein